MGFIKLFSCMYPMYYHESIYEISFNLNCLPDSQWGFLRGNKFWGLLCHQTQETEYSQVSWCLEEHVTIERENLADRHWGAKNPRQITIFFLKWHFPSFPLENKMMCLKWLHRY
jgi:hypothetical protein